jgi:hypothetical protein
MDPQQGHDEHGQPIAQDPQMQQQPNMAPPANPEDVERVKGKWGEDLNTAFQYEKYVGDRAAGGEHWASNTPRYEWNDDLDADAIAPRDEKLEKILFGEHDEGNMGINFDKYVPPSHFLASVSPFISSFSLVLSRMTDGRYDQINVTYKSTEKVIPIMKVQTSPYLQYSSVV